MRTMNRRDWLKTAAGGASIAIGLGDVVRAGVTSYGTNSHADDGKQLDTPQLKLTYQPADWPFANAKET